MKENENYSDKMMRELFQEVELKQAPPGLNQQIMREVKKIQVKKKNSINSLRPAWFLLFSAVILLPLFVKLIPGIYNSLRGSDVEELNFLTTNISFVFMVLMAGVLLLIAEQLIKLNFLRS